MPRTGSIPVVPLSTSLDKKLVTYVAAVGATCVGVGTAPQSAEAKIVYTAVNETINFAGRTKLDLNNDGVADFNFAENGLGHFANDLIHPLNSNHVAGASGGYWAAALQEGVTVGPGGKFVGHVAVMEQIFSASGYLSSIGPWVDAQSRYLGLELTINGQHHFGWARITMPKFGEATLTGYAYETVAGKPIVTGATGANDTVGAVRPDASAWHGKASLGLLARGASAVELWRREEAIA